MDSFDDLDAPWDADDDDASVSSPVGEDADDEPASDPAEQESPPSSSEMAGDGAVGGDGIDEPGWD